MPIEAERQHVVGAVDVPARGLEVGTLELAADGPAAVLDGDVARGADAHERVEHELAGVGPEPDAAHDRLELERGDVPLVLLLAGLGRVERRALADAVPDGPGPLDPLVVGDLVVTDRDGVLAGRPEHEDEVGERRPEPDAVPLLLDEQQPLGLRADRLRLRVLVDSHLAVEREPAADERPDHVAPEVVEPGHAVVRDGRGDLLDVDGHVPARLHHAPDLGRSGTRSASRTRRAGCCRCPARWASR